MSAYDLKSLNLPKLTGSGLKAFTAAVENPLTRAMLLGSLLENGGIPKLRRLHLEEPPTFLPLRDAHSEVPPAAEQDFPTGAPPAGFPYLTVRAYAEAYRRGDITPVEAAEKVLAAINASERTDPAMKIFIAVNREDVLAQARDATARIQAGQALSLLDGVPVAIKDELDMRPYPTTVGTKFMGKAPAKEDATVVARLRAAGALLVGKTNMHEIGITPNGFNLHYGAVRNPFNPAHDSGGSSSGSAAAVAAGIVPLAIGADGGGSIRIPAAFCGVVGLKATFGRMSEFGAAPLGWSVSHVGPLAASVEDTALAYLLVAGPDARDLNSQRQPSPRLDGWNRADLNGITFGIYPEWFEHASSDVVKASKEMLEKLKQAGAAVREITVPELDAMRIAHVVTILSEMAVAMGNFHEQRKLFGTAVRLSLVIGGVTTAMDYLEAQRMRTRALAIFDRVYEQVDVILTPGTALTAPLIPPAGLPGGWSDLGTDTEAMRFIFPGNFTGHPSISFPAGYAENGMPVNLQAMGRHWEEHTLLRVAYTAEQLMERRLPKVHFKII